MPPARASPSAGFKTSAGTAQAQWLKRGGGPSATHPIVELSRYFEASAVSGTKSRSANTSRASCLAPTPLNTSARRPLAAIACHAAING
eukprot:CAMPEP_0180046652 /NCGR_PEP_ID=MMETSP0984-20121128/37337_1 /TAXON_ID=483367 /ORGANISM="non described non described, Strain CCMP 2436" /LENGTH=88 /DNA_ID=CAMNT_0021975433 /DNA_START=339 /DNA_END=605 /DNA_ORIENTATION=+